MTLPLKAVLPGSSLPPSSFKDSRQEIPDAELAKHAAAIREALQTVCESGPFRTSPKSCEFLRHIVFHALDGETDVLKERLIGMTLLGRDASYDTASDAGVRVRANDVRKRLNAYNESLENTAQYSFGLPAGTYIPIFYGAISTTHAPVETRSNAVVEDVPEAPRQALSVYRLATPALVALFLCVIFLRAESTQSHSFQTFWNHVLPDGEAQLYLQPTHASDTVPDAMHGPQDEVDLREVNFAAPLLDLAGQFHRRFQLVATPGQADSGGLVYIGAVEGFTGQPDSFLGLPDEIAAESANRFEIRKTPAGRRIVDLESPQTSGMRGALLTVMNGSRLVLWIDGDDDEAIRMLVNRLCNQSTFPHALIGSFQPNTISQAVFPASPRSEPIVVHRPFQEMHAMQEWKP